MRFFADLLSKQLKMQKKPFTSIAMVLKMRPIRGGMAERFNAPVLKTGVG